MPISNSRYISRLTRDTLALVLAGGRGSRLHELTSRRAQPAVFVGGKFRIIDFPLSNCVNSGIRRISRQTKTDDSIVTGNCIINNASLVRAIIDRGCHLPDGKFIGDDAVEDARRFQVTSNGITVIRRQMLNR